FAGVIRSTRDFPPAHYIFKIQSFSLLSENSIEKYDSAEFESGGYKWKLSLCPDGDESKTGEDPYDTGGRLRRFHGMRTQLGFSQLIPLTTFNDPTNGYLMDDTCLFGAEVFVYKTTIKVEYLSMVNDADALIYIWKIESFSQLKGGLHYSDVFTAGDKKWKIKLYPQGHGMQKKKMLSLYLKLDDSEVLSSREKVCAECTLRIGDQKLGIHSIAAELLDVGALRHLIESRLVIKVRVDRSSGRKSGSNKFAVLAVTYWFSIPGRGYGPSFMKLDYLNDPTNSYLVNDVCIVEAEVTVLGVTKILP
ncbi:hypothetical protein GIB67_024542, partial [Kingdonia uniflora]